MSAVEGATLERGRALLDPVYQQEEDRTRTRLANQGLDTNSVAGQRALGNLHRQRQQDFNDLSMRSVLAGRQEHSRMFGQGVRGRQLEAGFQEQRRTGRGRRVPSRPRASSPWELRSFAPRRGAVPV